MLYFHFSYRSIYEPYKHLLSSEADKKVDKFLSRDRSLREYTNEIEKLKKMEHDIASFPVLVPMYFFLLDCSHFNQVSTYMYNIYHGSHFNQVSTYMYNIYHGSYFV